MSYCTACRCKFPNDELVPEHPCVNGTSYSPTAPTPPTTEGEREALARIIEDWRGKAHAGSIRWESGRTFSHLLADSVLAADVARRDQGEAVAKLTKERDTFRTAFTAANDQAEHNQACLLTVEAERDALAAQVKWYEADEANVQATEARAAALADALREIEKRTECDCDDRVVVAQHADGSWHGTHDTCPHCRARAALRAANATPAGDHGWIACSERMPADGAVAIGLDGETANIREAIVSGDPHRLLTAVGVELRSVAQYHERGFGADTVSVRRGFLRNLAACVGAADVLLSAAPPVAAPVAVTEERIFHLIRSSDPSWGSDNDEWQRRAARAIAAALAAAKGASHER